MRVAFAMLASLCAFYLAGCSVVPAAKTVQSRSVQGTAIQGKVQGGQSPLVGASVYLYAANNTGYGNAAISLLNANVLSQTPTGGMDGSGDYYVTTDSKGAFGITGDYTCPSTDSQLYLYASGGDPGGGANSAIGLLAALGTCPANGTLSSSLYIVINEVSTIATAYSIAGYATDAFHVSSRSTSLAQIGIANAFATVTNLETLSTGLTLAITPAANGGNGTVPQSEINTLANILAACVNSAGPTSTPCSTLFSNAMNGSTVPTNTATAAINIAHNPGANIASLFDLQTGNANFQPMLSAAPNDFTIAINYTGGGLNTPFFLAIDSSGDVWTANQSGNSISEFSPTGKALSGAGGFTGGGLNKPRGIAIDTNGNVWVTNKNGNSLSEFGSDGSPDSGSSGITGGGLSAPFGIAFDQSGHIWVANNNVNTISEFTFNGTALSGSSGFTGGGLAFPLGVAVDVSGNVWFANDNADSISEFNSGGPVSGSSGDTGGGLDFPGGITVDNGGRVWTTNSNNTLSRFLSGSVYAGSPYSGGGLNNPLGITTDSSQNAWVANNSGNSISRFNPAGTPITGSNGYTGGGLNAPILPAADGSGNVWVTNSGNSSITEFVGAASPVVTPVVANLLTPYGSAAVNKP